jgi:hypothetical protein
MERQDFPLFFIRHMGNVGIVPLILSHDTSWRWTANFRKMATLTPSPFLKRKSRWHLPQEKEPLTPSSRGRTTDTFLKRKSHWLLPQEEEPLTPLQYYVELASRRSGWYGMEQRLFTRPEVKRRPLYVPTTNLVTMPITLSRLSAKLHKSKLVNATILILILILRPSLICNI